MKEMDTIEEDEKNDSINNNSKRLEDCQYFVTKLTIEIGFNIKKYVCNKLVDNDKFIQKKKKEMDRVKKEMFLQSVTYLFNTIENIKNSHLKKVLLNIKRYGDFKDINGNVNNEIDFNTIEACRHYYNIGSVFNNKVDLSADFSNQIRNYINKTIQSVKSEDNIKNNFSFANEFDNNSNSIQYNPCNDSVPGWNYEKCNIDRINLDSNKNKDFVIQRRLEYEYLYVISEEKKYNKIRDEKDMLIENKICRNDCFSILINTKCISFKLYDIENFCLSMISDVKIMKELAILPCAVISLEFLSYKNDLLQRRSIERDNNFMILGDNVLLASSSTKKSDKNSCSNIFIKPKVQTKTFKNLKNLKSDNSNKKFFKGNVDKYKDRFFEVRKRFQCLEKISRDVYYVIERKNVLQKYKREENNKEEKQIEKVPKKENKVIIKRIEDFDDFVDDVNLTHCQVSKKLLKEINYDKYDEDGIINDFYLYTAKYICYILKYLNKTYDDFLQYTHKNITFLKNGWINLDVHYFYNYTFGFYVNYHSHPYDRCYFILNCEFFSFCIEQYLIYHSNKTFDLNKFRNYFLYNIYNIDAQYIFDKIFIDDAGMPNILDVDFFVYFKEYLYSIYLKVSNGVYDRKIKDILFKNEYYQKDDSNRYREYSYGDSYHDGDYYEYDEREIENDEKYKSELKENLLAELEKIILEDSRLKLNDNEITDIIYILGQNTVKYLDKMVKQPKLLFSNVYKYISKINKKKKYDGTNYRNNDFNDWRIGRKKYYHNQTQKVKQNVGKIKQYNYDTRLEDFVEREYDQEEIDTTKKEKESDDIKEKNKNQFIGNRNEREKDKKYKKYDFSKRYKNVSSKNTTRNMSNQINSYVSNDVPKFNNNSGTIHVLLECSWGTKKVIAISNNWNIEQFDKEVKNKLNIKQSEYLSYRMNAREIVNLQNVYNNDIIEVLYVKNVAGGSEVNPVVNAEEKKDGGKVDNVKILDVNKTNSENVNNNNNDIREVFSSETSYMKKEYKDKMDVNFLYRVDNFSNIINSIKTKSTAYVDSVNPQKTIEDRVKIAGEDQILDCLDKFLFLEHGEYKRTNVQVACGDWHDGLLPIHWFPNTIDWYVAGFKNFNRRIRIQGDDTPMGRYYYSNNTTPAYQTKKVRAYIEAIYQAQQDLNIRDNHTANYFNDNDPICSVYDGGALDAPCLRFRIYTICRQSDQYSCTRLANLFTAMNRDDKFADEITRAFKFRIARVTNVFIENILEDIFSSDTLLPMKFNHDLYVFKILLYLFQFISLNDVHAFNSHDSFNVLPGSVQSSYEIRRNIYQNQVPRSCWCTYTQYLRYKYGEIGVNAFDQDLRNEVWWFVPVMAADLFSPNILFWNILCRLPYPQFILYGFGLLLRWNSFEEDNNINEFHDNACWLNPLVNNLLVDGHPHICFVILDDEGIEVDPAGGNYTPVQFYYRFANQIMTYELPNLLHGAQDPNNYDNLDVALMNHFRSMTNDPQHGIFDYLNVFLNYKGWSISTDVFKMAVQLVQRSKQSFKRVKGNPVDFPEWPINPNGMVWANPGSENQTLGHFEEPAFNQEMYYLLNIIRVNDFNTYTFSTVQDLTNMYQYWKYSYSAACSKFINNKIVPIAILADDKFENTQMRKGFLDSTISIFENKMTSVITERLGRYNFVYHPHQLMPLDPTLSFHNDFMFWKSMCINLEYKNNYKRVTIDYFDFDKIEEQGFGCMKNDQVFYHFMYKGDNYIAQEAKIYNEIVKPTLDFIQYDDRNWELIPLSYDYNVLQNNGQRNFSVSVIYTNPMTFERPYLTAYSLCIDNEIGQLCMFSHTCVPNLIDDICLLWTYRVPVLDNPFYNLHFAINDRDAGAIYLANQRVQKWEYKYADSVDEAKDEKKTQ